MRLAVRSQAHLSGMGLDGQCEVVAIRTFIAATGETVWSKCQILSGPENWPDGDYALRMDAFMLPARKEYGLWLVADEPDADDLSADYAAD